VKAGAIQQVDLCFAPLDEAAVTTYYGYMRDTIPTVPARRPSLAAAEDCDQRPWDIFWLRYVLSPLGG
jgi:hypothetical protein